MEEGEHQVIRKIDSLVKESYLAIHKFPAKNKFSYFKILKIKIGRELDEL